MADRIFFLTSLFWSVFWVECHIGSLCRMCLWHFYYTRTYTQERTSTHWKSDFKWYGNRRKHWFFLSISFISRQIFPCLWSVVSDFWYLLTFLFRLLFSMSFCFLHIILFSIFWLPNDTLALINQFIQFISYYQLYLFFIIFPFISLLFPRLL